ncbi:hypothetical protein BG015_000120 [Linnemannia schmuckeri]|uniref:DUF7514 domain-containing protein n=1 Tax=Linnemannia schmuckeri TaxID=64567 RepID=A0A9P5RTM9_9FUNG|nr:hypothetical protein BG015_000120 [Linnemannia schmuckeri]
MAHQLPLLDYHYNPTETLHTFSNAVFNYLDTHYEPKGTHLLEPEKMRALLVFLSLPEDVEVNRQLSSMYFNIVFLAHSVQTVFTAHGPAVTPAGLITYLRSEIMSDPDTSGFKCFEMANKAMRLRVPFSRSQFPPVAEPRAKELQSYIEASVRNTIKDMGWSAAAVYNEELEAMKMRMALEQRGQQIALDLVSPRICYSCHRYPCTCGASRFI